MTASLGRSSRGRGRRLKKMSREYTSLLFRKLFHSEALATTRWLLVKLKMSNKGPSTCKKYREEFQEAERNDDAFKCKQCDQHPDWHERLPAPPPAVQLGNYPIIHIILLKQNIA